MRLATLSFVPLAVLALVSQLFAPWWALAVVGLAVGLAVRPSHAGYMFWPGLLAGGLVWGGGALFGGAGGGLPSAVAELFGVGSALALGIFVALAGGLTVGLSSMCGAYLRAVAQGRPPVRLANRH